MKYTGKFVSTAEYSTARSGSALSKRDEARGSKRRKCTRRCFRLGQADCAQGAGLAPSRVLLVPPLRRPARGGSVVWRGGGRDQRTVGRMSRCCPLGGSAWFLLICLRDALGAAPAGICFRWRGDAGKSGGCGHGHGIRTQQRCLSLMACGAWCSCQSCGGLVYPGVAQSRRTTRRCDGKVHVTLTFCGHRHSKMKKTTQLPKMETRNSNPSNNKVIILKLNYEITDGNPSTDSVGL